MNVIPVTIDRSSPVPLYHQLAEQLTASIEDGRLKPGDPFENELALAERLDLSRPTVRRAIAELVSRGLLVRRRGVGTTVASQVIHRRDELTSLYDDMVRRGQEPQHRGARPSATDAVDAVAAEALGLPADTHLVSVERLRSVDGTPTALMHNWLPPQFADLTAADLEDASALRDPARPRRAAGHRTPDDRRAPARCPRAQSCSSSRPATRCSR